MPETRHALSVCRPEDFEDAGALWGYCRLKWAPRAMLVFEALRQGHAEAFTARWLRARGGAETWCRVASVGGGPGNDLFGVRMFQQLVEGGVGGALDLHVFDFAAGWRPMATKAAAVMGAPIHCAGCDLRQPLTGALKTIAAQACTLLSYFSARFLVLRESGQQPEHVAAN
jgi:hypothetical protein